MSDGFTEMPCGCSTISVESSDSCSNLLVNLYGLCTKPHIVGNEESQLDVMVSIESRPAGPYALTGIHQSKLTDRMFPFDTVDATLNTQRTIAKYASAIATSGGVVILILRKSP